MPKKIDFDYTLEQFYQEILGDLESEPPKGQEKEKKPNALQTLLTKSKLEKKE